MEGRDSSQQASHADTACPKGTHSPDWIILRGAGGDCPPVESVAYVSWVMRRAIIALVDRGLGDRLSVAERRVVLSTVSGHEPSGAPLSTPHVAFVPLFEMGALNAWARMAGMAVVPPLSPFTRFVTDVVRVAVGHASGAPGRVDPHDRKEFVLTLGALGEWALVIEPERVSQRAANNRFVESSTRWASVTPVVLDRFPKRPGDVENIVAAACTHAGLPRPISAKAHTLPAFEGVAPSHVARDLTIGGTGWWTRWRDEDGRNVDRFRGRLLQHVVIEFEQDVAGPVLLGAGRYHGLGLCHPV